MTKEEELTHLLIDQLTPLEQAKVHRFAEGIRRIIREDMKIGEYAVTLIGAEYLGKKEQ